VTLPLKFSFKEQHADVAFLWTKNKCISDSLSVYGNKCFTKQTVYVWCKKMLGGQKFVSDTEVQSVVLQWHGQQPALFFASGIQKFADR